MIRIRTILPILLLTALSLALPVRPVRAQSPNQAALVIRDDTGGVYTQCISFDEPQISGYDVLLRSGLEIATEVQGLGALVCSIDGLGCSADNCLCQCQGGGDCVYWSYWQRPGDAWIYSAGGAAQVMVSDGEMQGWSWGPGSVTDAIPPPDIPFGDVCHSAPAATPTPLLTPTGTPLPPPEITFGADAETIPNGSCTTLRWQVANVSAVYLDGNGVTGTGVLDVCPAQTASHALRVVHPGGEETRTVTVTVLDVPPTPTSTTQPSAPALAATATPVTQAASPSPTVEPATVADNSAETSTPLPPTATASPTPTAVWIAAPALPTATPSSVAVAEAVATSAPTGTVADNAPSPAPGITQWAPYALFAAIVVGLGSLLWVARRR